MTFKTDLADDISIFFDTDELAAAAKYKARGATTDNDVTVLLIQVQSDVTQKVSRGEGYYVHSGRLWCQVSEVDSPQSGDVFTVGSIDWVVQEILGGNGVAWELSVYKSAFAGAIR